MSRKQHNNEEVHNCSNGKDVTEGVVRKERRFSPKRAVVLVYFHRCKEELAISNRRRRWTTKLETYH